MIKLLEKYYNINYYCTYKLLFFIFERMLNPFYWLSLSKWNNRYIKRGISMAQKQEAAEMYKGINSSIIIWATNTPCIISFWMLCLVCLACIKIFRVELLSVCWEHLPLYFVFRNHRAVLVLCQSYILIQERQVQKVYRQIRQREKVSALLRHLCRFSDSPVRDFLSAVK